MSASVRHGSTPDARGPSNDSGQASRADEAEMGWTGSRVGSWGAVVVLAGGLLSGCGDAFSFYAPPQKTRVELELAPNFQESGVFDNEVIALLARPDTRLADLLDFAFGDDIIVTEFSTGSGTGCTSDKALGALEERGVGPETLFPICFKLTVREDASPGPRLVTLDLDMDGVAVIARATFIITDPDAD